MGADVPDFVIPIPSGMEDCPETDWRLPPDVEAEVRERLRELDLWRAQSLVSAQRYVIL